MTKEQLNLKCRTIRDSYRVKEIISNEDKEWLIDNVFKHHPQWGWWKKQGVENISIGYKNNGKFTTKCFYIHFINPIDKKCADISWNRAIANI